MIYQGSLGDFLEPFIWSEPELDIESEKKNKVKHKDDIQPIYSIWKVPVFMSRPRMRLQAPSAVFCVTAEIQTAPDMFETVGGYLPSGVPIGMNLLESFANDPELGGITPRLSALRVSRVAPLTSHRKHTHPLRAQRNMSIRIYPALHTRVRFARPNTSPPSSSVVALLEIDFTPYFDCEIIVDTISLFVANGLVEDLNYAALMVLPLSCVAHDHITFMYRLTPTDLDFQSRQLIRDLHITIDATILVYPKVCQPKLTMSWTTALDFTLPVNPSFGPAAPAIQRSHRPGQLSISGGGDISSMKSPSVTRPDAIPTLEAAARSEAVAAASSNIGLAITLTGPSSPVQVGEVFSWSIFVVNHSSTTNNKVPDVISHGMGSSPPAVSITSSMPRKLALTAIPRRRRNESRITRPPSMSDTPNATVAYPKSKTGDTEGGGKPTVALANPVLDENVVHALQRNSLIEAPGAICLSADTRVGPLAPGACHATELKFLALKAGVVQIEALRVVDLGSSEHIDVCDLPITIVEERSY